MHLRVNKSYFRSGSSRKSQVMFALPKASPLVLECPNIRPRLQPRDSPMKSNNNWGGGFVDDDDKVALQAILHSSKQSEGTPQWTVRAGAREKIYFNPAKVNAGIVTCGGLCPGLNDVTAGIVGKLHSYGVPENQVLGIRYGFSGFHDPDNRPIELRENTVNDVHLLGGTILGTCRGEADIKEIVKRIDLWGLNQLYVVGGSGGNAGAHAIHQMCVEKDVDCCVIGIPKSIDNDLLVIDRCFGFDTAVEEAQRALLAAKSEAFSAKNGVGLVKLMGRNSGFITMQASMAAGSVDVVLIPEEPFKIEAVLSFVDSILKRKGHCVISVAEGAGQEMLEGEALGKDASGNVILKDIGAFIKSELKRCLPHANVKYIDPTYMIRAVPPNSADRLYCKVLAHNAVHAAMAGFTGVTVGLVNTHFCLIPTPSLIAFTRTVDPHGEAWTRLRSSISQPNFI